MARRSGAMTATRPRRQRSMQSRGRIDRESVDQVLMDRDHLTKTPLVTGGLPAPGRGAERQGEPAIQAAQRTIGNQATQRLLQRANAVNGGRVQPIQRLLMTSNQFIHGVGISPHSDIKFFGKVGPTLKSHSTHYKAVLTALDHYHKAVSTLHVDDGNSGLVAIEFLDDIVARCKEYTARETKPDPKMRTWLDILINDATLEKRTVSQIMKRAAQTAINQKWSDAIGFGELGGLTVPDDANVEPTADPGVEATFAKNTTLYGDRALKSNAGNVAKGALCVRHETSNPKVLHVETYTMDKSTGKAEPKFGIKGYVRAKYVKKSVYTHAEAGKDTPLFIHPPCIDDINQQAIGDCYLVAALGSIVKANPAAIYNMIKDNRDPGGTVTVRLYDVVANPPRARYLQINKSVISHGRHSAGALWVPMIEKAYAALAINYQRGVAHGSSSYVQLGEGGKSHLAFMVLTGQTGATEGNLSPEGSQVIGMIRPWSRGEVFKFKAKKFDQMVSYALFNKDATLLGKWVAFLEKPGLIDELEKATRIEEFTRIITKYDLEDDVKTPLLAEVKLIFPGKRGTGVYTQRQVDTYDTIANALAAHQYVAIGSKQKVARREEGKGGSAGESKAKGLAGSHAYSVLSVRYDDSTGRRWVRVRNPWGDLRGGYGRVYKEKGQGILGVETDELRLAQEQRAEFDLELSDLTKRFDNLYISG